MFIYNVEHTNKYEANMNYWTGEDKLYMHFHTPIVPTPAIAIGRINYKTSK